MPLTAQDIVEMPADRRRRIGRRRGQYKKEHRPALSRGELIEYLCSHKFNSSRQLEAGRDEGDPNTNDFRKEFGSWQKAKIVAFGSEQIVRFSAEYMAKAVVQFGLWTSSRYRDIRRKRPDVLPSYYRMTKEWGTFGQLKNFSVRFSIVDTLNLYLALSRKLGRTPTVEECEGDSISLEAALRYYGSKRGLDKFLKETIGGFNETGDRSP
jgi:hypothetical protein